jgi:hypothetical protein
MQIENPDVAWHRDFLLEIIREKVYLEIKIGISRVHEQAC